MPDDQPDRLHFKRLTPENFLEPDPTSALFVNRSPAGGPATPMRAEDWAGGILAPSLGPGVPTELHGLLEAARGILVYGHFFYPLFTLGMEQLHRVADAATVHRCRQLGAPKGPSRTFAKRVEWLHERGVITERARVRWDAARDRRNASSHADRQNLMQGNWCFSRVSRTVDMVNALFRAEPETGREK